MSALGKTLALLVAVSAFGETTLTRRTADSGVAVELTMRHVTPSDAPFREGNEVAVSVRIADEQSGAPLRGLYPTAWMSVRRAEEPEAAPKRCLQKVATFTTGNLFKRPEVDLNEYHVIVMNDDATVSVVDPHFSFGGTRLLKMFGLAARAEDWALASEQTRLFVTMPAANKVAVIDTLHWKVVRELDAGMSPRRIVAQPDGALLWVARDGGVTALRGDGSGVAGRVDTGAGPHDIAVSRDNRWVFVTNRGAGTTSVIDVSLLRKSGDIETPAPVSVAWSPLGETAVTLSADGLITSIDPLRRKTSAIKTHAGIDRVRFSNDGRFGFIPNPTRNTVEILDAASGKIVQTADIGGGPFEVTFTNQLAYVRRMESDVVLMLPLAELGREGAHVSAVDFPAGQRSFGAPTTPADGVVPAPGEAAVLVANPADKSIYYYREGMAAPMGTFGTSGKQPRALLVFDRTLRETAPGTYTTTVRLGRPGPYDFALLVNSPRVVACLDVPVAPDPVLEAKRRPALLIEPVGTHAVVAKVGQKVALRVRALDPVTKQPRSDLKDMLALVSLTPGVWQQRVALVSAGNGEYLLEFASPETGTYHVYLECPSAGLRFNERNMLIIEATG